jgi:hypothetical protein
MSQDVINNLFPAVLPVMATENTPNKALDIFTCMGGKNLTHPELIADGAVLSSLPFALPSHSQPALLSSHPLLLFLIYFLHVLSCMFLFLFLFFFLAFSISNHHHFKLPHVCVEVNQFRHTIPVPFHLFSFHLRYVCVCDCAPLPFPSGCHPNAAGYAFLANCFQTALNL